MPDTKAVIAPIIYQTFGKGGMPEALVEHLAAKIDADDYDSRGREYMVMVTCWDWFSGGGTAQGVAAKIESALSEVTA